MSILNWSVLRYYRTWAGQSGPETRLARAGPDNAGSFLHEETVSR